MIALLVDDSRAMRRILARQLMDLGFDVREAAHGVEALEEIEKSGIPDIALVDWNMPEMDGLELVKRIRGRQETNELRLLMVTSETEMENVQAALDAGANEYLMKPFTKEELALKLDLLGLLPD